MSQVAISGNASGTGVFTVASPNSNTNYTLTLPTATGTLVNSTDTNLTTLTAAGASDITGVNTTATVTSGTTSMTVGSGTGIVAGMYVVAVGITPGTTVSTIVGTAVTLSANAGTTLSAAPVTFYAANKVVTPASIGGQTCRSWVNFNGTGTIAIRAAFNVSSITDLGAGLFQVNFTTAMVDANYAAVAAASSPRDAAGGDAGLGFRAPTTDYIATSSVTSSSVAFSFKSVVGTLVDPDVFAVAVFR
jgi:hypothetical protein